MNPLHSTIAYMFQIPARRILILNQVYLDGINVTNFPFMKMGETIGNGGNDICFLFGDMSLPLDLIQNKTLFEGKREWLEMNINHNHYRNNMRLKAHDNDL